MIISDLNYLETISETDNLLGGKKSTILFASPITQININVAPQVAVGVLGGSATNIGSSWLGNGVGF
ncbi:MAG TPA: hypothetical protein V6D26_01460 [Stenomitos sp.]